MTQSVPPHPAPNHCRPKRVCEPLLHSYLPFSMNSVVIFFFFFAVLLPSVIPKLPLMPTVRRFSIAWKLLLFHNSLPRTALHPYLKSFVFIFIFIFCPTSFWRDWFTFLGIWDPLPVFSYFVEVALHAELLMYLWERKWSPCPIPPSSWVCLGKNILCIAVLQKHKVKVKVNTVMFNYPVLFIQSIAAAEDNLTSLYKWEPPPQKMGGPFLNFLGVIKS